MVSLEQLRDARSIGFLFSGGAFRTVFQVGAVQQLAELGIHPSMCLGVSAGSWNAAAVAVGNRHRLRHYWRCVARMPYLDVRNIVRERTPFIWSRIHDRAFSRYVGVERLREPGALPVFIAATRLRDRTQRIFDLREERDPLTVLLAANYLPPYYTRPPIVDGEAYGDGGFTDNIPYRELFDRGCDVVVLMACKGESEGGLYRNPDDFEHRIPAELEDRILVVRPRHRMPLPFVERRWDRLEMIARLGALRVRELLLEERHPETELAAAGLALTVRLAAARRYIRSLGNR